MDGFRAVGIGGQEGVGGSFLQGVYRWLLRKEKDYETKTYMHYVQGDFGFSFILEESNIRGRHQKRVKTSAKTKLRRTCL